MKSTDGLYATFTTLVHAMKSDTRFSTYEQADLTAIDVLLDASSDTTRDHDMRVIGCLKKVACDEATY